MKTIGLIGGMSWASTALYYRLINQEVMNRLGGLRSARVLLASLDFAEVVAGQKAGEWDRLASLLGDSARRLERAGADIVLIATNTMHKVADAVQAQLSVPLLHIGDVTADAIRAHDCRRVALLGTRYTMEQPFYVEHLARRGVVAIVPGAEDRAEVHRALRGALPRRDPAGDVPAAARHRAPAAGARRRRHRARLHRALAGAAAGRARGRDGVRHDRAARARGGRVRPRRRTRCRRRGRGATGAVPSSLSAARLGHPRYLAGTRRASRRRVELHR